MNLKLKITLIIIVTLIIGVVIGAMAHRAYLQNRIRRTFAWGNPNRFGAVYERMIRPKANQSEQIRKILARHAQNISKIRDDYRQKIESEFEAIREEINPLLTPEQKRRLSQFFPRLLPFRRRGPAREMGRELSLLRDNLRLTEEQTLQVRRILEETESKMRMSYMARKRLGERQSTMEKLKEEKEKAIEKILTEDQKKLYAQIIKKKPR